MRRLAAMLLTLLMLTSCAPQTAKPVTSGFTCNVDVSYDEAVYKGMLEVHDDGKVVFVISQPATVQGLTLTFIDDTLTVTFAGMELALSETQVPVSAVARLSGKAFEQAAKQASNTPSSELQGDAGGVAYTLCFDEETGLPTSLSVPSYALSIGFSVWQDMK